MSQPQKKVPQQQKEKKGASIKYFNPNTFDFEMHVHKKDFPALLNALLASDTEWVRFFCKYNGKVNERGVSHHIVPLSERLSMEYKARG